MNPIREAIKNLKGHWIKGQMYKDVSVPVFTASEPVVLRDNPITFSTKEVRVEVEKHACGLGHMNRAVLGNGNYFYDISVSESITRRKCARLMDQVAREQFPERARPKTWPNDNTGHWFASFNDDPATTEDEVISVMEKAAILWDEKYE